MPWDYTSFITHYIGIPIYAISYVGFKFLRKTKAVKMTEMDLTTGSREFADLEGEDEDDGYSEMTFGQKVMYNIKNW